MRYPIIITTLILTFLLSACGGEEEYEVSEPAAETEAATQTAAADRNPLTGQSRSEQMQETETAGSLPESDEPSPGMQMTVDGSGVEEFEESMKVLQKNLTAEEFQSLKSAVQYLQLYDFSNQGKERLYASLDDMTPDQIRERAKEVMQR